METLEIAKSKIDLKVNAEYEAILPKLSREDFDELKLSIKSEGQHYSIIVNADSEILDGHHRYQACQELGIEPRIETKTFPNKLLEKKFVIESNLRRRHLNNFQRAKLVLPLLEIQKEFAKQEKGRRTDLELVPNIRHRSQANKSQRKPLTQQQKEARNLKAKQTREEKKKAGIHRKKPKRSTEKLGQKVQLSHATLEKAKIIRDKASERLKEQVESGQTSIESAYRKVREEERQVHLNIILKEKSLAIPESLTLLNNDFTLCNDKIGTDSVQLILTDPPYSEEYLDLWEKLGVFANRVLVSGGFLVSYCPHFYLPMILNSLSKNLEYFWTIALVVPQHRLIHSRHVFCDWKPLIVFNKPPRILPQFFGDLIKGEGMEKNLHEWQQGEAELSQIIETFCPPNGIILDPMAGSGTTLAAARKLNRKAIGIEKDRATFEKMKERLTE